MAAGSGSRFGEEKQFKKLKGKSLYIHSLNQFLKCEEIYEIIIVVPERKLSQIKKDILKINTKKQLLVVSGGVTRQKSVKNGVLSSTKKSHMVCIHDGARPFVTEKLIKQSIKACSNSDGVIAAIPNYDTLKICIEGDVQKTIDRNNVWMVQTPQVFWKDKLLQAIASSEKSNLEMTDESSMMEYLNFHISVVKGDVNNFKITSFEDWERAENIDL